MPKPMSFTDYDTILKYARSHPGTLPGYNQGLPMKQRWVEKLLGNPLLQEYLRHKPAPNTRPEHALGEQLEAQLALALVGDGEEFLVQRNGQALALPVTRLLSPLQGVEPWQFGLGASMWVSAAQPYLWTREMIRVAREAPLPPHTIGRELMPYPQMFFSREVCYTVKMNSGRAGLETNWILLGDTGSGVRWLADLVDVATGGISITVHEIPYGARWPDDFEDDPWQKICISQLLQQLYFIASPYIEAEATGMSRGVRKRLERQGSKEDAGNTVRVVRLRRAEAKQKSSVEVENEGCNWKHQWWVSGHYRAQWRPSTKDHKVIWIAPYLKGPADKPVLEKIYKVER